MQRPNAIQENDPPDPSIWGLVDRSAGSLVSTQGFQSQDKPHIHPAVSVDEGEVQDLIIHPPNTEDVASQLRSHLVKHSDEKLPDQVQCAGESLQHAPEHLNAYSPIVNEEIRNDQEHENSSDLEDNVLPDFMHKRDLDDEPLQDDTDEDFMSEQETHMYQYNTSSSPEEEKEEEEKQEKEEEEDDGSSFPLHTSVPFTFVLGNELTQGCRASSEPGTLGVANDEVAMMNAALGRVEEEYKVPSAGFPVFAEPEFKRPPRAPTPLDEQNSLLHGLPAEMVMGEACTLCGALALMFSVQGLPRPNRIAAHDEKSVEADIQGNLEQRGVWTEDWGHFGAKRWREEVKAIADVHSSYITIIVLVSPTCEVFRFGDGELHVWILQDVDGPTWSAVFAPYEEKEEEFFPISLSEIDGSDLRSFEIIAEFWDDVGSSLPSRTVVRHLASVALMHADFYLYYTANVRIEPLRFTRAAYWRDFWNQSSHEVFGYCHSESYRAAACWAFGLVLASCWPMELDPDDEWDAVVPPFWEFLRAHIPNFETTTLPRIERESLQAIAASAWIPENGTRFLEGEEKKYEGQGRRGG